MSTVWTALFRSTDRKAQSGGAQKGISEEELVANLKSVFESATYKPPTLPTVALEVHELSHKPDVEVGQIVKTLEKDPVLAAQVLKLSKAALYGASAAVTSLKQAVVRLGLNTLRNAVLEAAMGMRVFRAEGYSDRLEELRRHSVACAHLSKAICRASGLDEDRGFLCGLLHDMGIAAALIVLGDVPRGQSRLPLDDKAWRAILHIHQEAGGRIVQLWGLPHEIALVLRHHHPVAILGVPHPFASAVRIAESLASSIGMGFNEGEQTEESLFLAKQALKLDDEGMAKLKATAEKLKDSL
jgi:HD-like signal output (HDOD) protein